MVPHLGSKSGPTCSVRGPCRVLCSADRPAPRTGVAQLKRKPTRIELKPDDREEYFAHKEKRAQESKDKPTDMQPTIVNL